MTVYLTILQKIPLDNTGYQHKYKLIIKPVMVSTIFTIPLTFSQQP